MWKSAELPVWKEMATFYEPKLVVQGGVAMFVGGEDYLAAEREAPGDRWPGFPPRTAKCLWTATHPAGGYRSPEDLLVIDGKMWAANTATSRKDSHRREMGTFWPAIPAPGREEKKYEEHAPLSGSTTAAIRPRPPRTT